MARIVEVSAKMFEFGQFEVIIDRTHFLSFPYHFRFGPGSCRSTCDSIVASIEFTTTTATTAISISATT